MKKYEPFRGEKSFCEWCRKNKEYFKDKTEDVLAQELGKSQHLVREVCGVFNIKYKHRTPGRVNPEHIKRKQKALENQHLFEGMTRREIANFLGIDIGHLGRFLKSAGIHIPGYVKSHPTRYASKLKPTDIPAGIQYDRLNNALGAKEAPLPDLPKTERVCKKCGKVINDGNYYYCKPCHILVSNQYDSGM